MCPFGAVEGGPTLPRQCLPGLHSLPSQCGQSPPWMALSSTAPVLVACVCTVRWHLVDATKVGTGHIQVVLAPEQDQPGAKDHTISIEGQMAYLSTPLGTRSALSV
jgi:hypothetical protein